MKIHLVRRLLLLAVFFGTWTLALGATESDLIALLQSNADAPGKCDACRELRVRGTAASVPALAALLGDDRIGPAARHALEGIGGDAARSALRNALARTTGSSQAGIIVSLGTLRDAAAVPALAQKLREPNPDIATAAAAALGEIGGGDAITALRAAQDVAAPGVRARVLDSLLKCADRLRLEGKTDEAGRIYASLSGQEKPEPVRLAAWRGQILANISRRNEQILAALVAQDAALRQTALSVARETADAGLLREGIRQWKSLPPAAQCAMLDIAARETSNAPEAIQLGSGSTAVEVRTAAWQAVAEANDLSQVRALATAAAGPDAGERAAARQALNRLRGPRATEAILSSIASAQPAAQMELVRALGERADPTAAPALLELASKAGSPLAQGALLALGRIAAPDTLIPLLQIGARSGSDEDAVPAVQAAAGAFRAAQDRASAGRDVIGFVNQQAPGARGRVLAVLPELGTPEALQVLVEASRSQEASLKRQAVAVLAEWPTADAAEPLLEVSRTSSDPATHGEALRGAVKVSDSEANARRRLAILEDAMAASRSPVERKLVLSRVAELPTPEALQTALGLLENSEMATEAALAALSVAGKLGTNHTDLAARAAATVIARVREPAVVERYWSLRGQTAAPGGFIRNWLVSGPYRKEGANSALELFSIAFAPETGGGDWKTLPAGNAANLYSLFPDQQNCVAYLRTSLVTASPAEALLLMGSDDGLKVWLNGEVVHTNNVDRGQVVDQDRAAIRLRAGTNELMLKVTQGGGGWSACARIVGVDGRPVPGLQARLPAAAPAAVPVPAPKLAEPTPQPSRLPPRDHYRKLRLSDQFYAEGAHVADFNGDGHLDVVAGPFWFEGPQFATRHEYRPVSAFNAATEYSDNFLTYTGDFNGDKRPDVLCVPFPGKEGYWYANPGAGTGHWPRHLAYPTVGNESPILAKVVAGAGPQLLFCNDGFLGYAGPDPADPTRPWKFQAVTGQDKRYQRFTHGVGCGDINGDGRNDVVESAGWWEQPAALREGQPWKLTPFRFADAGAQMLVYDVNGDGLADVITSWHCHLYGMLWWQQVRESEGKTTWIRHEILPAEPNLASDAFRVSQLHALTLVDMNGDGLQDILTGKRFWSHGPTGDKEPGAPAVLFWLQLKREGAGRAAFVPHLIDDDSGVGTQVEAVDLNADGRPDPVVANKKGIFIHLSGPPAPKH